MISLLFAFFVLCAVGHHVHTHATGHAGACAKTGGACATTTTTNFGVPFLAVQPVQPVFQQFPLLAQLPPPPPLVTVPKLLPVHAPHVHHEKAVFHKTGLIQVQLPQQAPVLPPAMITTQAQYAVARPKLGKVVDQTEPTYFCKRPGFVLEGQMCVQTLVEQPQFVCPGGFETLDGGCTRRASFLQTCPAGYIKKDGQCAKLVTAAFVARCPDGTVTADGACERQVTHPLTPTCPNGAYDSLTGTCVVQTFTEARAYCPEGFVFNDGTCLQEEVYDCTEQATTTTALVAAPPQPATLGTFATAPLVQQAPMITAAQPVTTYGHAHGHTHGVAHAHHHKRILTAKDCDIPCTATPAICILQRPEPCAQLAVTAPPPPPEIRVQPTKTTVTVQKTCTRVTSTALIFACDEGVLQGNRCLVKQNVPPVPTCTALGDTAYCYARQRVPAIQECPLDFTKECPLGRQCECVALEAATFLQSCPSGFDQTFDGCFRRAQIRAQCPPGFALQGDVCVRILREPADCVFSVTYECDQAQGTCIP